MASLIGKTAFRTLKLEEWFMRKHCIQNVMCIMACRSNAVTVNNERYRAVIITQFSVSIGRYWFQQPVISTRLWHLPPTAHEALMVLHEFVSSRVFSLFGDYNCEFTFNIFGLLAVGFLEVTGLFMLTSARLPKHWRPKLDSVSTKYRHHCTQMLAKPLTKYVVLDIIPECPHYNSINISIQKTILY